MNRPKNIKEFVELMTRFRSEEALSAVDTLETVDTDVIISTFAKSGTTWMQQIVHQLRSGADESFNDIYEVVPWIESALDMGIDPSAEQKGDFRAFKSHLNYEHLPKNTRYITVFRDPATVIPSWFRFFEGWLFEVNSITIDEFADEFYFPRYKEHQSHFVNWYERVNQRDTLLLCYEDLVKTPEQVPRLIANFLKLNLDSDTMNKVIGNCSREYMFQQKSKFEERHLRSHIDSVLGLPSGGDSLKVNQHATKVVLSNNTLSKLNEHWQSTITDKLGFESYAALRQACNQNSPLQSCSSPSDASFISAQRKSAVLGSLIGKPAGVTH